MSNNYGLFYDQWRTACPSCKREKLIAVSVCLAEAGQEHNPCSILPEGGSEVNAPLLVNQPMTDETVRCSSFKSDELELSEDPKCFAEKQELDAEHFQDIWRTSAPELVASLTQALNAVKLVDKLRYVLYWDCYKRCWDPDKTVNADALAAIDECFEEFDLKPAP